MWFEVVSIGIGEGLEWRRSGYNRDFYFISGFGLFEIEVFFFF